MLYTGGANTRCSALLDTGTPADASNWGTTVATHVERGTIFEGRIASHLWCDILTRLRSEVVEVSPDRWLALPIRQSAEDRAFYRETRQGFDSPLQAALYALAFLPSDEPETPFSAFYAATAHKQPAKRLKSVERTLF